MKLQKTVNNKNVNRKIQRGSKYYTPPPCSPPPRICVPAVGRMSRCRIETRRCLVRGIYSIHVMVLGYTFVRGVYGIHVYIYLCQFTFLERNISIFNIVPFKKFR